MATVAKKEEVRLVIPTGDVYFRRLVVNADALTFFVEYSLDGESWTSVRGNITYDVRDWFRKPFANERGEKVSAYMSFLERKGIDFKVGLLPTLEFSCNNRSELFDDFPFRLNISEAYGSATLNLVYRFPKVVVGEYIGEDGKLHKEYGYMKYRNMKREYFRRLEIYEVVKPVKKTRKRKTEA